MNTIVRLIFFQPRQCTRRKRRGRIAPRFVAGAVPSLGSLSVDRCLAGRTSKTKIVLHCQPATSDRPVISNSFVALLVAQGHCRIHARSALGGNHARRQGNDDKRAGCPRVNAWCHQRYPEQQRPQQEGKSRR